MTELTSVADLLDAAADRLERHGWIQGAWNSGEGSCAVGAIDLSNTGMFVEYRIAAVKLLAEHIRTECDVAGHRVQGWPGRHVVAGWNDQPDRTAADVITAMRKTALTAREQA